METNHKLVELAIGLQSAAWMALGKVANPATGKAEVNLPLARDCIDTLLMLKEKTKGNLTQEEQTIIEHTLSDLEINYVEVESDTKFKSQNSK